ncbi:ribonuclease H-like domain-containing protein [Nemania serpens]|nr:ribonuclease H-like domain-containing protein [Nemania serpens]
MDHGFEGPALSGPTSSCSIEIPCILYHNGNTVVTVTTAHRRHFSASRWHNSKASRRAKAAKAAKAAGAPPEPVYRFKWVSQAVSDDVSDDVYDGLVSHILDSSRRASEGFPAMPTSPNSDAWNDIPDPLNPYNPENQTPPPFDPDSPYRPKTYDALAIDCEMVSMTGRRQGLLSIAVVDFFSGDVVLRSLVRPADRVTDWRQRFTGVDKKKLLEAARKGKVLSGWEDVRERIFDVTTSETIFIGHALANDLRVLRIATDRVVDSMTMMTRTVFGDAKKYPRNWSLKTACQELLDVEVQTTRGPHSPLEDAFATRELVLRCVQNPEKLAEWGARTCAALAGIVEKEQAKQEAKIERRRLMKAEKAAKSPEQLVQEAAERAERAIEKQRARAAEPEAKMEKRELIKAQKREKRLRSRRLLEMGEQRSPEEVVI